MDNSGVRSIPAASPLAPTTTVSASMFPVDYFDARERFRELASRHTAVESLSIAAPGPGGEALTLDAVYFGAEQPSRLLLLTTGVHGVEGYAGSVLQQQILADAFPLPPGVGVLLVHAVNPWGYAHGRRVNENNVDLNRNGLESFPGRPNPAYARLAHWLNPRTPPVGRRDGFWTGALGALVLGGGYRQLRQAIAGGQYEYPNGLFYGGTQPEASLVRLAELLARRRYTRVGELVHLDVHTGLGRRGAWKLFVDADLESDEYRLWQGGFGVGRIATEGDAGGYAASGTLLRYVRALFPVARAVGAVLEFGTYPPAHVLRALRAENAWHQQSDGTATAARDAKLALRECFWPADAAWRGQFLANVQAVLTTLRSLVN